MRNRPSEFCVVFGIAVISASFFAGCGDDLVGDNGGDGGGESNDEDQSSVDFDDPAIAAALDLPSPAFEYEPTGLPNHFNAQAVVGLINTPNHNPITDHGATLGRVLFFDTALSANDTISCASCHQSVAAFSDNRTLSLGFEGGETGRNSMSLVNLRYYGPGSMFWDERAATLEEQVLMPIQDPVEMGMELDVLVTKLATKEYYAPLFEIAFGDSEITAERISLALAQYVRSKVSFRSRYDAGLAAAGNPGADFANFTEQENLGKQLFFAPPAGAGGGAPGANCAVCHVANNGPPGAPGGNAAIFFMDQARNNGLHANTDNDQGLGAVTGNTGDNGKFKSSSLRNIAHSAPYMHDGSLATLRDVVAHYNSGIEAHPNLDNRLRQGPGGAPQALGLSEAEIDAVVAFMRTLSDEQMENEARFSDPFL